MRIAAPKLPCTWKSTIYNRCPVQEKWDFGKVSHPVDFAKTYLIRRKTWFISSPDQLKAMASTSTEPLRLRMMTERPEDPYEKDLTQPSSAEPKTGYFSAISSIRSTILSKFYSESGSTAYKHTGTSEYSDHKAFLILGDFLQPDTTTSLGSALNSILDILPDRAPLSKEVWSFGVLCFEIAQQIPYSHPSQQKLARLLEGLKESEKVTEKIYFNVKLYTNPA